MELSVQIETFDLSWDRWRRVVADVERLGYAGLYICDHFEGPDALAHLGVGSLDAWTALTYLADHSRRLRFGPLVSPLSFREPVVLARQARDLDDLTAAASCSASGRAGWSGSTGCSAGASTPPGRGLARLAEGLPAAPRGQGGVRNGADRAGGAVLGRRGADTTPGRGPSRGDLPRSPRRPKSEQAPALPPPRGQRVVLVPGGPDLRQRLRGPMGADASVAPRTGSLRSPPGA